MVRRFIVALLVAIWDRKRHGINTQQVMDLGFIAVFSAFIGARLVYVLIHLSYYKDHPLDVLKVWQGGLVFFGGFLASLLALSLYLLRHHLSLWKTGDFLAPSVAIGQAIGRIGCFMAGCCFGHPTSLGCGVTFPAVAPASLQFGHVAVHPSQLYGSGGGFLIFLLLLILERVWNYRGATFGRLLVFYGVSRFSVDFSRYYEPEQMMALDWSNNQWISMGMIVAGLVVLMGSSRYNRTRERAHV